MVGGLVEHQDVVSGQQHRGKRHPAPLTSAEVAHAAVQVDLGQQMFDHGAGVGFRGPDVVGPSTDVRFPVASLAPDDLADGGVGGEVVGLVQIAHRQSRRVGDAAGIRLVGTGQDLQQGGLAVAVAPDDPDRISFVDAKAHRVQQCAGPIADRRAFNVDQVRHQPPIIGRRYAMMTRSIGGLGVKGE